MITSVLTELFQRDLNKLKEEINSYSNEHSLWITEDNIKNSAGNLCLHIVGNLQHFISAVLGNSDYVRDREAEFNEKDIPKEEMLKSIDHTEKVIITVLESLSGDQLAMNYPIDVFKKKMTTAFFLIHLAGHLNYHLGQINYHRRLLDNKG